MIVHGNELIPWITSLTGKLRQILARYKLKELGIHAVYPQRAHVPPKVRAFVDFLAQRFGRKPEWEKF